MTKIINSEWWDKMHLDMEIKHCDYPNHNCLKVSELDCKDCRVYQFGKHHKKFVEG